MGRTTAVKNLMVKPSILTESKTLTDSDSGRTFFLNAVGGFTITLPSPRGGVNFKFVVKTTPTTNYTIVSKGTTDVIGGQVITSDIYGTERQGSVQTPGVAYVRIIAGRAKVGDSIDMVSDGTYWYANGYCGLYDAIQFVEQSASPSISPSVSVSRSPSVSVSISPSAS